jgi:hypothetical protein
MIKKIQKGILVNVNLPFLGTKNQNIQRSIYLGKNKRV